MRAYETEARGMGHSLVAGVDEAGRGPLAGPVVAAAVVLPENFTHPDVNDSKKLTEKKREAVYNVVYECAVSVGIGIVDAPEIDRINVLQAALLAMSLAVDSLAPAPDYLLIDGTFGLTHNIPNRAVKFGDGLSVSIAAASIVAKVTRDRMMVRYDEEYPGFGFANHKGYGTEEHRKALDRLGFCPIHRRSFGRRAEQLPLDFDGND